MHQETKNENNIYLSRTELLDIEYALLNFYDTKKSILTFDEATRIRDLRFKITCAIGGITRG